MRALELGLAPSERIERFSVTFWQRQRREHRGCCLPSTNRSATLSALLSALQLPNLREGLLTETGCVASPLFPAVTVGGTARLGHPRVRMSQSNIDGQRVSIRATASTRGPRCTYLLADVAFWQIVFSNSGLWCQALRGHPCRANCSLRGSGLPSA
jgi:hypothetical protein